MAGLLKILLVEDNPQIVEIYASVLTSNGYLLAVASTVDEALEKAQAFLPNVIFLDIMLPGNRSGIDALITLRTDPKYGCTRARIVMLSNLGLTNKLEQIWQQYADGYIIKADIVPHDLLDVIASLNDEPPAENASQPSDPASPPSAP